MGRLTVTGLEDFVNITQELATEYDGLVKRGLYDGAKVLADALDKEVGSLDTKNVDYFKQQVKDLQDSLGISKMTKANGRISTSIGFAGYNSIKTKKYPSGQPNVLVARSINSGASYMPQQPFVKTALKRSKQKAITQTTNTIKQGIQDIQKKG